MNVLENRSVLVTGANRGLGRSFVELAIERGAARVIASARRPETCDDLKARFGGRVETVKLDVADPASIDACVAQIDALDLLISNAGVSCIGPFLEQEEGDIRTMFETNLFGPLRLTRKLLPLMENGPGGILYVLSMAALMPALGAEAYSASKAGAAMLAHGVRSAVRDRGIGVTLSYPGFIDTDLGKAFDVPRATPAQVAARSLDGWERGETSVFPDLFAEMTRDALLERMPALLSEPKAVLEALVGEFLAHPRAGQ